MSSSPAEQAQVHTATSQLTVFIHQGAGKTILLLHGGPGVPDYLEPVAAMLAPRYRVARYDQRGVGKSLALNGSYALEEHLADLDAVRSYLGVPQLHLFGHSWGGLRAQLYWSKHPERTASLVLCNSSTGVGRQWTTMEAAVMRYNRAQAGLLGWSAMGLWSPLSRAPGRAGRSADDGPGVAELLPRPQAGSGARPGLACRGQRRGDPGHQAGAPAGTAGQPDSWHRRSGAAGAGAVWRAGHLRGRG